MKAVKGYRYLYRRGDQLYFRRRVPLSATATFDDREEVQKALGTSNIAEARHLLAIEVATFDKMIADAAGKPVADAVRQIVPNKQPSAIEMEEAVRKWLGVSDPNVWPNHGWRHRFKTQARIVGMDPETRDAIQGHVPRTEGEGYGGAPAEVTWREIKKLPRYKVEGA